MDSDDIICPRCHIYFFDTKNELNTHLKKCDGAKDIICPRFYKISEINKKIKKEKNLVIFKNITVQNKILKRPVTR